MMSFKIKSREDFNIEMPVEGIFNSSTDIFGLVSGAKKAVYLTLDNDKVEKFLEVLNYFGPDKEFKIVEAPDRDWIYRLDGNREKRHLFIGEDYDHLLKLKNAFDYDFSGVSHQEIGVLLSYPKCCASRKDYMIDIKSYFPENPYKINFLMNNFHIKSDSNIFLFSHHPCSHQCKETLEYSKKVYEWLDRFPEIKKKIGTLLKLPVAYLFPEMKNHRALSVGIAYVFKGHYEEEGLMSYDDLYYFTKFADDITDTEEAEDLLEKFKLGNKLKVGKSKIEIFEEDELKETIENERLILVNPQ